MTPTSRLRMQGTRSHPLTTGQPSNISTHQQVALLRPCGRRWSNCMTATGAGYAVEATNANAHGEGSGLRLAPCGPPKGNAGPSHSRGLSRHEKAGNGAVTAKHLNAAELNYCARIRRRNRVCKTVTRLVPAERITLQPCTSHACHKR